MLPTKQALTAAATIVAATLFAIACNPDASTAPRSIATSLRAGPSLLASDEDEPAPPGGMLGPVPIPAPYMNYPGDGGVPFFGTAMTIPAHTSFVVKVSGNVSLAANPKVAECWPDHRPPYGAEGSYGPLGVSSALGVRIGFTYKVNGATGWVDGGLRGDGGSAAASDTGFYARDLEVWASRSGYISAIGGGANCPPQGFYLMTSDQTISVVMLDGVALQLDPKSAIVRRGTKFKFVATADGAPIDGVNFTFTAPEGITNTNSCAADGPGGCLLTVNNDGELKAFRDLKGRPRSAKATVTAYSTFALEASENEINEGDKVLFTPLIDGKKGIAARWVWREGKTEIPNPCTEIVDGVCVYSPAHSGTMSAYTSDGQSASADVKVKGVGVFITFDSHAELLHPTTYPYEPGALCSAGVEPPRGERMGVTVTEGTTPGGRPVSGQQVTLTIHVEASSGGHLAHHGDRPRGSFDRGTDVMVTTKTVTTDANGHASFTYYPGEFSGSHWIQAEVGESLASDMFRVGVELQPLPWTPQSHWLPYGTGRDKHPDVYFGVPGMNRLVIALADSFNIEFDKNIYYNDGALPLGGRFDIHGSWTGDHCSHRWGNGLDVHSETANGVDGLTDDEIRFVSEVWKKKTNNRRPTLYHAHHFHLQWEGAAP